MGFGQGLSGLRAQAQKLDVIGNNIANAGTVGFKSSTVSFADVYASSRVGLGTQVAAVNQNFGIGSITSTGGQFDMAIDGATGLFRVVDSNGNVLYTRNGEFSEHRSGYLVNSQGHMLTGYEGDSTTPTPIRVPSGNIEPSATTRLETKLNLNSKEEGLDPASFDPLDPATFHHYLPVTVYDSHGNPHQLSQYFIKTKDDVNTWEVYFTLPSIDPANPDPIVIDDGGGPLSFTLVFDEGGRLKEVDTNDPPQPVELGDILNKAYGTGGPDPSPADGVAPLTISLNFAGSTQFAGDFAYTFDQNGYPTGEYSSMSIGPDGQIIASYTNGETKAMGYLVLANFPNVQGLQPVGGNAWRETSESGQPVLGRPGSNGMALIKGQALEESNVDIGTELVNMIITQRTYQANAQTITTQSEVLQTLLNIR